MDIWNLRHTNLYFDYTSRLMLFRVTPELIIEVLLDELRLVAEPEVMRKEMHTARSPAGQPQWSVETQGRPTPHSFNNLCGIATYVVFSFWPIGYLRVYYLICTGLCISQISFCHWLLIQFHCGKRTCLVELQSFQIYCFRSCLWSVLENVPCALERNLNLAVVGWNTW